MKALTQTGPQSGSRNLRVQPSCRNLQNLSHWRPTDSAIYRIPTYRRGSLQWPAARSIGPVAQLVNQIPGQSSRISLDRKRRVQPLLFPRVRGLAHNYTTAIKFDYLSFSFVGRILFLFKVNEMAQHSAQQEVIEVDPAVVC